MDEKKGNKPRNDGIWKKVTVCYVEVSEVYPAVRRVSEECFSAPKS